MSGKKSREMRKFMQSYYDNYSNYQKDIQSIRGEINSLKKQVKQKDIDTAAIFRELHNLKNTVKALDNQQKFTTHKWWQFWKLWVQR